MVFLKESRPLQWIVFSDLDGTLLDHDTYEWEPARQAIHRCKELDLPIILVSSKTRAEIEPIRQKMSIFDPFITENGGAVFFQPNDFSNPLPNARPVHGSTGLWMSALGLPYPRLITALKTIRDCSGLNLKGFSDMSLDEIRRMTGLDPESARRAAMREYDEPFYIPEEQASDQDVIVQAANKLGLNIVRGGRFYHLQGGNNKGRAMDMIISLYKQTHDRVTSIALGDSPNDFPMLERADYPVLIRSEHDYSELKDRIPSLRFTLERGPVGWNSAVLDILSSLN